MATKKEKGPSMIETFQEFKETKNIDRTTLVSVLEESFRNVIAKMFGSDENYDVIVNPDKGDFEIHRNRIVVADGEVKDENKEIALSEAQKIEPDYEVGEGVGEQVQHPGRVPMGLFPCLQTIGHEVPVHRLLREQARVLEARGPDDEGEALIADEPALGQLLLELPVAAAGLGPKVHRVRLVLVHGPHGLGVGPEQHEAAPALQLVAVACVQYFEILPTVG